MISFNRNSLMIGLLLTNVSLFCMSEKDRKEIENRRNATASTWENAKVYGKSGLNSATVGGISTLIGTIITRYSHSNIKANSDNILSLQSSLSPLALFAALGFAAEVNYFSEDQNIKSRLAGLGIGLYLGNKVGNYLYSFASTMKNASTTPIVKK